MNIDKVVDRAFTPVRQAIDDARIPGAVLGAVTATGNRTVRYAGMAQLTPVERPMAESTWFDLASLSKVLFTTPRILEYSEQGRFSLDDPLITMLPDLQQYNSNSWIRQITFAQCLSHQSALPAVEPIYTYGRDESLLRAFILQRDWRKGPPVYSDINFILLGLVIERIEGKRIRQLCAGQGFAHASDPLQTAATEFCTWRHKVICGEVHDDNCFALQGAGHAGLFGTASSLLDYAQGLLDGTRCSIDTIKAIRTAVSDTRTIGWQRSHKGWSGGDHCSHATIGHTGFTGTGLWIDFETGLAWTLLSNRIHPTRHFDSGIDRLRCDVANRLYIEQH